MGKVIIFSAPSGSGKSTIIGRLMQHKELRLAFSVSCTSRQPRGTERNGVEYFFLSPEEFRQRIANNEFLEYEEVYKDRFYGTLKQQVDSQLERGENVVLDVDVKGGCNIKKHYGDKAISLFIQPPSIDELRRRLEGRGTDAPEVIADRLKRAAFELSFAPKFDRIIINDELDRAANEALDAVREFVSSPSIGLFGGSFNPIHNGHISLARQLLRLAGLDEVWFMVSPQNPLKGADGLADDDIRMEMAREALKGEPHIVASDYEFHLPRPSYTWHTLQSLSRDYPQTDFTLLIGADNWACFNSWFAHEKIAAHHRIVIYPRSGSPFAADNLPPNVTLANTDLIDISSTDIRRRIRLGQPITHLVPPVVEEIIKKKKLYR